jgi:hypothetical protein
VEVTALDAALAGRNFAEICGALAEHLPEDEVPLRAASLIATWLDSGLAHRSQRADGGSRIRPFEPPPRDA